MISNAVKLFLRLALSASFLSAVADRFGFWPAEYTAWGNWEKFVSYTALINPWCPAGMVNALAAVATGAEVLFAMCMLVGYKTELFGRQSGWLLLMFALAMASSTGIKGAFDYSVFSAAAAGFALGQMRNKYLELDNLLE